MHKKDEDIFIELLGLYLAGSATQSDIDQLRYYINTRQELKYIHDELIKKHPNRMTYTEDYLEQIFAGHYAKQRILSEATFSEDMFISENASNSGKWYLGVFAVAAALLILFVGWLIFIAGRSNGDGESEIIARKGFRSEIELPDGTLVYLNSDSKITYDGSFNNKTRNVILEGEAFFNVAHDAERPFLIHTGRALIKVLGTSFNVRNYANEKFIQTSLITGKIELTLDDKPGFKLIQAPAEKISVQKNGIINAPAEAEVKREKVRQVDKSIAEISWMENKLFFENEPLSSIAKELERRFNVSIVFKANATKDCHYTLYIDQLDLKKVMDRLSAIKKIIYTITDDKIVIIE